MAFCGSQRTPRVLISAAVAIPEKLRDGRTDLVFEYLAEGHSADSKDEAGVSLLQWCAYYGDVSAMKFLLPACRRTCWANRIFPKKA